MIMGAQFLVIANNKHLTLKEYFLPLLTLLFGAGGSALIQALLSRRKAKAETSRMEQDNHQTLIDRYEARMAERDKVIDELREKVASITDVTPFTDIARDLSHELGEEIRQRTEFASRLAKIEAQAKEREQDMVVLQENLAIVTKERDSMRLRILKLEEENATHLDRLRFLERIWERVKDTPGFSTDILSENN